MNILVRHIEYLLRSFDCVVLPGWGAFLIHERPAVYDSERGIYLPPSRNIGFNADVRLNDGLLAGSIARASRCTIEQANAIIASELQFLRSHLDLNGEFTFGRLGVFTQYNSTAPALFTPSELSLHLNRFAAMPSVEVKPLFAEESTPPATPTVKLESTKLVRFPTIFKIAASLIFILISAGLFYSTSGLVINHATSRASLDSGLLVSSQQESEVELPTVELSREIALNIAYPTNGADSSISDKAKKEETPVAKDATFETRYLIVVASFPTLKQAQRHMNGHPDMRVILMDGKYRVYVDALPTSAEAHNKLKSLASKYPEAWVCKL